MQPFLVGRLVFAQVDTDPARDSQLERGARARRGEGRHRRAAQAMTRVEAAPAEPRAAVRAAPRPAALRTPALVPSQRDEATLTAPAGATPRHRRG